MALSSISQATLLADLRLRLREASASVWTDAELQSYLNVAQYETAVKLNGISDVWYGTVSSQTSDTNEEGVQTIDLSSLSILKIIKVIFNTDTSLSPNVLENIPIKSFNDLHGYRLNSYYSTSKTVCSVFGEKLYLSSDLSLSATKILYIYYYRKPTEMDGSNGLDVPPEYQDLVLMFATAKAYEKLDQPQRKDQIENEIKSKIKEIKQSFLEGDSNDISPVKKSDKNRN